MSTEKNNKLISEFMDLNTDKVSDDFDYTIVPFHSSWDWLMTVVEKIENTYILSEIKPMVSVRIVDNLCIVEHDSQHARAFKEEISFEDICITRHTKILAVYDALIEFINWYNEQSKT